MFKFSKTYINKKTGEPVKPWAWQWKATMRATEETVAKFQADIKRTNTIGVFDVPVIHQFDDKEGVMIPIGELQQEDIKMFTVFNAKNPSQRYDIVMQPGMKVLFLRRHLHVGHLEWAETTFFVFGYKQGNQHHFTYLMPDGRVFMSNEDNIDVVDLNFYPQ